MDELLRLIDLHYGIRTDGLDPDKAKARAQAQYDDIQRRPIGIEPTTIDYENRSVHTIIATEDPVSVVDWARWEVVDEVLLMAGCRMAEVRQGRLPLLNNHRRESTRDLLGSVVNLTINGSQLEGDEFFSRIAEPEFVKTAEGHLDQRSVGYKVFASTYIEPGETATVEGKTFTAPSNRALKVCTDWIPHEESCVLIGADPAAGTRSAINANPKPKQTTKPKGNTTMDPKLRQLLVELGMRAEATDEEAQAFLVKPETQAAIAARTQTQTDPVKPAAPVKTDPQRSAPAVDPQEAIRAERQRVADIRKAAAPHMSVDGVRELVDSATESGDAIESFRAALLDKLATSQSGPVRNVQVGVEDGEKRQRAQADAILVRAGITSSLSKEEISAAGQFRSMSLLDMVRDDLRARGVSEAEIRSASKMDLVGGMFTGWFNGRTIRAMHSTGDFTNVLANSARKVLLAGYGQSRQTWRQWCGVQSVPDFKTADMDMLSNFTVLSEVPEGAEYPQHSLSDKKETGKLTTRGNIFAITRQAIINDDLNAFSRVPMMQGLAAGRTLNRLAITKLLANGNLADGSALFVAGHSNLLTGAAYAPTTIEKAKAGLNALKKQLRLQTGIEGETLDLEPYMVLGGPTAEDYLREAISDTSTIASDRTPNRALRSLDIAIEPELENTGITGYSTTAYYLFANPVLAPVVVMLFLDGNDQPYLEQQEGFDVDGVKYKVRIDAAAAVADHRGGQKATGEAE